ncbi:3'-5' exonuclease [Nocardioides kribbensis]|uniref:3'-5' exonuclease n=1 Tax=Nocardioides kribbensis TaxID=305517 RepID=UPI00187A54A6|nr:3'-5' exonuclease [Nocardioides kribbensis]
MARTHMEALDAEVVAHRLTDQLAEAGGRAIRLDGDGEPSLVLVHPHIGLVAVDVDSSDAAVGDQTPFLILNEKVHTLRRTLRIDAAVPIGRVVLYDKNEIDAPVRGIGGRTSISPKQLVDLSWMDSLAAQPLGDQLEAEILGLLEPAFTFTTTFRSNSSDEGRHEREAFRVTLDARQAAIAQRDDLDVALIQGPPGSGKTLVLASRARWLAARHPGWRIKLLCYNNALVPYLQSLVDAHPNVDVKTMWPLAQEFGVRFSFESDGANYRSLAEAARFRRPPIADAILIDEVQDFRPSWLAIAYQALAPDRGGLVMAGDSAQSLYGNYDLPAILKERGVEELKLERPYRSTRNILGAIGCLNDEFSIASLDQAPDGEPVELIWANSPVEQAKAIAWETQQMLVSGDRKPRDIAVVIPRYKGTLAFICPALEALSIPFTTVITKEDKKTFNRTADTVKIITPHSAKGHEFPVVFMFGLDTLKAFDPTDVESVNVGRGGFVGATRAKDQLLITYTKHNSYLDILSTDETYVRRWLWPDQYDGVETNG